MKLSRFICPWCEKHRLHYVEGGNWAPYYGEGIKLACSDPGEYNCPDTTGFCNSEEEADAFAKEVPRTKEIGV